MSEDVAIAYLTKEDTFGRIVQETNILERDFPRPPERPSEDVVFHIGIQATKGGKFNSENDSRGESESYADDVCPAQSSHESVGQPTDQSTRDSPKRAKEASGQQAIVQRTPDPFVWLDKQVRIQNTACPPTIEY